MSEIKTRVFVDEDWKSRIQREKEEARLKSGGKAPDSSQAASEAPEADEATPESDANPFFEALLNMLATQAMYCLGFIGAPGQGQTVVNLEQAKEAIDMILMVRDKTRGNLTAQEDAFLSETMAELQRLFAARVQQAQAQAMQRAGIDMNNLRGEGMQ